MVSSYRQSMLISLATIGLNVAVLTVAIVSSYAADPPKPSASPAVASDPPATPAVTESKAAGDSPDRAALSVSGREIFLREWIPNDPRSHGGDGLGPVFNESSCVSCHNQGGVGGGGAESKNITVISAVRTNFDQAHARMAPQTLPAVRRAGPPRGGLTSEAPFEGPRPAATPAAVPRTAGPLPTTAGPAAAGNASGKTPVAQSDPPSNPAAAAENEERQHLLQDLRKLHPGLVTARSVILHNSGTDPKYTSWRDRILGLDMAALSPQFNRGQPVVVPQVPEGAGFFATLIAESQRQEILDRLPPPELQAAKLRGLLASPGLLALRAQQQPQQVGPEKLSVAAIATQRNSTALFGTGLIDSIPDTVLEAGAARANPEFPEISGRVARLKDGRIGRFGWKAQKANLHDFTMTACAIELGLHVPDHPQAGVPMKPDYVPAGFDLNRDECRDLVQFLRDLPAPTRRVEESAAVATELKKGEQVFAKIGCAACHTEQLGSVAGIYSDLLLHDMGAEMGDSGSYGAFQPQSSGSDADDPLAGLLTDGAPPFKNGTDAFNNGPDAALQAAALKTEEQLPEKMIGAGRQEWRTPPLWGVRDSAPYMHDGRAGTIEQAIATHGGEGQLSANRYFRLPPDDRASLLSFLRSLVAPDTVATASK